MVLVMLACPALARDLTLAQVEDLVGRNNRELMAARRTLESADAQTVIAGARPNATFSVNSTSIASGTQGADTVFRIDQPFERGDKRALRLDAASGLRLAAQRDSLDVLRQQLAAARAAYFDLKQAQERAQVLDETAALFGGTLNAAQVRLKAGDLAAADVARVEVDYGRAQNDARAARAELARAQLALAYLIGEEAAAAELSASDAWPACSAQMPRCHRGGGSAPRRRRRRRRASRPPSACASSPARSAPASHPRRPIRALSRQRPR